MLWFVMLTKGEHFDENFLYGCIIMKTAGGAQSLKLETHAPFSFHIRRIHSQNNKNKNGLSSSLSRHIMLLWSVYSNIEQRAARSTPVSLYCSVSQNYTSTIIIRVFHYNYRYVFKSQCNRPQSGCCRIFGFVVYFFLSSILVLSVCLVYSRSEISKPNDNNNNQNKFEVKNDCVAQISVVVVAVLWSATIRQPAADPGLMSSRARCDGNGKLQNQTF